MAACVTRPCCYSSGQGSIYYLGWPVSGSDFLVPFRPRASFLSILKAGTSVIMSFLPRVGSWSVNNEGGR